MGGLRVDQTGQHRQLDDPDDLVPGMGGAMDLVSGAKRVIVAMQHSAKGAAKVVKKCTLPITAMRPVDLVVTEMAVIGFPGGRATLIETGPGVSVEQVVARLRRSWCCARRNSADADLRLPRNQKNGERT